jgi:hypothetical protein
MHYLVNENLSHIVLITLLSLRFLFLVSILHSSQKTSESLLFGSECMLKHYIMSGGSGKFGIVRYIFTFAQIEWPQTRVRGSTKYSRQLKQESVVSIDSKLLFILLIASIIPFLIYSNFAIFFSLLAISSLIVLFYLPNVSIYSFCILSSCLSDYKSFSVSDMSVLYSIVRGDD